MARIVIFVLLLTGVIGGYFYLQNSQPPSSEELVVQQEETQVQGQSTENTPSYSLSELETHNNKEDCWIAIEGKVYDLTEFISRHPGGEAILVGCGTDATELYNNRPNGSGEHSSRAKSLLPDYYIGELK